MVKATRGTLVECDVSVKEILLSLDNELHFIVEDVDERHLFVETSQLAVVKKRLDAILNENVFKPIE